MSPVHMQVIFYLHGLFPLHQDFFLTTEFFRYLPPPPPQEFLFKTVAVNDF